MPDGRRLTEFHRRSRWASASPSRPGVTLYFVRKGGFTDEVTAELRFLETGRAGWVGGLATSKNEPISTRKQNAGSWLPMQNNKQPIGTWVLKLPNDTAEDVKKTKAWFTERQIEDVLLVITFSGETPAWPD